MVQGRVGTEQRQTEAVLSLDRPVAGAAVAPQAAEHRFHVPGEARRHVRIGRAGARSGTPDEEEKAEDRGKMPAAHAPVPSEGWACAKKSFPLSLFAPGVPFNDNPVTPLAARVRPREPAIGGRQHQQHAAQHGEQAPLHQGHAPLKARLDGWVGEHALQEFDAAGDGRVLP